MNRQKRLGWLVILLLLILSSEAFAQEPTAWQKVIFPEEIAQSTTGLAPWSHPIVSAYADLAIIQVDNGIFNPGSRTIQPTSAGKVFYQHFPDDYDFLVVYPFFEHDQDYSWHTVAQNSVQGIGLDVRDVSSWFGSAGKLLGVSFCTPATKVTLVTHEIGHQWGSYLLLCPISGLNQDSLFRMPPYAPYHWTMVHYGRYGVMGGIHWVDRGNGTYARGPDPVQRDYLPVQLYVMGLIGIEEMPYIPFLLLDEAYGWLPDTIKAHQMNIFSGCILAANGPRIPSVAESPKHFRAAFIILTMGDSVPSGSDKIEAVRRQLPEEFARATGYRATMETRLSIVWKQHLPLVAR